MRGIVDWVSPQRPEATDIAEYTIRVAEALDGHFVLNTIGNDRACDLSAYRFETGPFYNIGNDARFHGGILSACRSTSGIVVAHDYRIQDMLIAQLAAAHAQWDPHYVSLMHRHYGPEGARAARDFLAGTLGLTELAATYPGIEVAAENALCIVTHNPGLVEELAQRTGLYCAALPLPFPVRDDETSPASPRAAEAGLDLLVFGYMGTNRCLDVVLDLVQARRDVRLHIAGHVGPDALRERVRRMIGEGHAIKDLGFVEEKDLDRFVRESDLVVNLRHPSMGEVSGSQLRIFANKGLSVVCDTGWYATLPDAATLKLRPDRMQHQLSEILDQLLRDRTPFDRMRLEGYGYVRESHSLARFAASFDALVSSSADALAHGRRLLLAKHIGGLYERAGARRAVNAETLLEKATRLVGGPAL